MRKRTILASILALGLALAACSTTASSGTKPAAADHSQMAPGTSDAAVQLRLGMRKLWEDHITWTRLFIISAADGLKDHQVAAGRLLRNQDDIGNAIKPYYGDAAGTELTGLLREHILVAADLLTAAKAGKTAAVEKATKAWYANADEITDFLAAANPDNWPKDAVGAHMRMHLDLTLQEAVARLQGKYNADVVAYDKIHDAILELSDALAAGIVAQFPEKFVA